MSTTLYPATRPFDLFVLDIKYTGIDGIKNKPAVVIIFMDVASGIVFHSLYTTQTGQQVLVKFLRYIVNKYNFGSLKISYNLLTSFDPAFEHIIKMFLADCKEIFYDAPAADELCTEVRKNFVNYM